MSRKGFAPIVILLVVLGVVLAGAAGYFALKKSAPVGQTPNNQSTSTPTSETANWKTYSLPQCGLIVKTKIEQPVNVFSSGGDSGQLLVVGKPLPNNIPNVPDSILTVDCTKRNKNPQSSTEKLLDDVSFDLSVQSSGSSEVNKKIYLVFDNQTMSSIDKMYSAKNRGYRKGSETLGFENSDWIYTFSFLNPSQARNQDSFILSVTPKNN